MSVKQTRKIIMITDGDRVACKAVQQVAHDVGGRCISASAGNPTPLNGEQLVKQILQAVNDPVLVMFDDNGQGGYGMGEQAIRYVAQHPQIEVLGAIAVASNTEAVSGTHFDLAIDATGHLVQSAVDKDGHVEGVEGMSPALNQRIYGDTVDVLDQLDIPLIIGVGDIGKMEGHDHIRYGCPVTKKAVELILQRSGFNG
ncbi:stage V sporulation protein AE [Bacillus horti]|uniref:Stage V sporulation protein AE n=1 Tax=Caldalkalibacillus horti TaxID=77523 RepID=A0ABT9VUI9_9BACI|nr:stage V sporulation protein AE [Bacillus horti]MDQ0164540.1 stage V sporulation protein AE [Bacillus horti]